MPNSNTISKSQFASLSHRPLVYRDALASNVNIGSGRTLPRFVFDIYESRRDLQQGFPNPFLYYNAAVPGTFYDWVCRHGVQEYTGLAALLEIYLEQKNCQVVEVQGGANLPVAIIVPSLNRRERLIPTLRSVVAQSYPHWKLYLVDETLDAETRHFACGVLGERRVEFLTCEKSPTAVMEENVARARNFGMRQSTEPLIAHLDDDNLWHEHHLQKLVEPFEANPELQMTFALHRCIDQNTGRLSEDRGRISSALPVFSWEALVRGNFIASDDVLMRREILASVGYIREDLPYYADWEYWLRIIQRHPVQQIYEMLSDYFIHEMSITERLGDADFRKDCERAVRQTIENLSSAGLRL